MDLTEAFKFLTIITESFKLVFKNLKPMSAIASISLIAPSILVLLLNYCIQFLAKNLMINLWVILSVFFLAEMAVSTFTRVSTTLVSAASCTGKTIYLQQVFPMIKSTLMMQLKTSTYISRFTILATFVVIDPNLNTVPMTILVVVPGLFYEVHVSVVWVVAMVVSVIEQDSYAKKALERANQLVEGNQVHGFLLNLLMNLTVLLGFAGYRLAMGDKTEADVMFSVLFMVNCLSLLQMFLLVAYTVSYFESKKRHGPVMEMVLANEQISNLSTEQLGECNQS